MPEMLPERPIDPGDFQSSRVPLWLPSYLTPLDVTPLDDGVTWRVNAGFCFESAATQQIVCVQRGDLTDWASVPRVLWILWPPTGKYGRAAVIHDKAYRTLGLCTRADADAMLLEGMTLLRVPWLTRWCIYLGVRLGGASSYQGGR